MTGMVGTHEKEWWVLMVRNLHLNIKNKRKIPFLKELFKHMEFVEVLEQKTKTTKKKQLLDDIDEAVDFVNKHKAGKVKAKSIQQLLDEL